MTQRESRSVRPGSRGEENRTPGSLLIRQLLSPLSYTPEVTTQLPRWVFVGRRSCPHSSRHAPMRAGAEYVFD